MNANLKVFGFMNQKEANSELKLNLSIVKQQAEAVLHEMDLLIDRCAFNPDEDVKWKELRSALLNFRTLEVDPVTK